MAQNIRMDNRVLFGEFELVSVVSATKLDALEQARRSLPGPRWPEHLTPLADRVPELGGPGLQVPSAEKAAVISVAYAC